MANVCCGNVVSLFRYSRRFTSQPIGVKFRSTGVNNDDDDVVTTNDRNYGHDDCIDFDEHYRNEDDSSRLFTSEPIEANRSQSILTLRPCLDNSNDGDADVG